MAAARAAAAAAREAAARANAERAAALRAAVAEQVAADLAALEGMSVGEQRESDGDASPQSVFTTFIEPKARLTPTLTPPLSLPRRAFCRRRATPTPTTKP